MLLQVLLVALVVLSIVIIKRRPKDLVRLHTLTKVNFPYIPIIGHSYKFLGTNEDHMTVFDELARQAYRNKYGMASFWFANRLCVSISDPASASAVLKTCFDKWPFTLLARHLLGNGSVFGEEHIWRLRRKILTPMFSSKYHDKFVRVFERNNKILMEELAAAVGRGDVSVWKHFSSYALDSALDMTFGENVNAQKHANHPFVRGFEDYFKLGAARLCKPWLYSNTIYKLLPAGARQRNHKKVMWDFVENLIHKKKDAMSAEQRDASYMKSQTFLELLMEFSGGEHGYTNTELREETLVLILAATDTSASAVCFALVLLAHHPEVQNGIYEEILKNFGDSEQSLSGDDLRKLKYLDAVVKEALRLYPPIPVTLRYCKKDMELRLVLPEGCSILLNFWGVHRNPHYWGADADEFNPERFLNATPEQLTAYMPFSNGPRNCTGMRLGLASMKLSIAETVRRYRVSPASGLRRGGREPLRVSFEVMLKHVDDFKVRLENRIY